MMNPHMVVKLVPRACWPPPRVAQLELAPGNAPIADSLRIEKRWSWGRKLALRVHCEPLKETPSHLGWNEEQMSTHAVKSNASRRSRTSPSMFLLHKTVNS
jgi:hypothetical protein